MRLKKIDAKVDIEKRPLTDPKKLVEELRKKDSSVLYMLINIS